MKSRTYIATFAACAVAALAPAAHAHVIAESTSYASSSVSYYQSGATKTILAAMRKGHTVKTSASATRPDNRSGRRGI